jgi:hypothetical protein
MVIFGIFVFGGVVMLLWNALLPALFHFPVITFWQALGLLLLTKILFSGFRGPGGHRGPWKDKMKQRWMNMTPEERENFKQEWGRRCRRPFDKEGFFNQERNFNQERTFNRDKSFNQDRPFSKGNASSGENPAPPEQPSAHD